MIPKLLLTASLFLVAAMGCDCEQPQCDGPQCDPFALGQTYITPAPAWTNQYDRASLTEGSRVNLVALHETKNGDCSTCPQDHRQPHRPTYTAQSSGYQGTQYGSPIHLNPGESLLWVQPLSETRPAPQATMPRPQSTMPHQPTSRPCTTGKCPPQEEAKEGIFRCASCGRNTVGRQWHELWTADRISLTCMCEHCWRRSTPSQRESTIRKFAEKSGINIRSATVQAILREAKNSK